jgi:hypothetical protein
MRKSCLLRFLLGVLLSHAAWAQRIQNTDMFFSAGPVPGKTESIEGTNVVLSGSTGYAWQADYGYQFARLSAVSVMADLSFVFASPGNSKGNVPGSVSNSLTPATLGLRMMIPVQSRLSFYAVSGGGAGGTNYATVTAGANPSLATVSTIHGVFAFGGGADVRLSRLFSLRAEVRDLVTGKGLAGVDGRHHILPFFGVAIHF